ncbi:hypothetical protein ID866_8678 [Astraeus odoratus]|nr:hypothetical protein ID866_8678 [Astraeus odoratus]
MSAEVPRQAVGTHSGIVHVLDLTGKRVKSFKPHQASVSDMEMDSTADFVATSSIDGQVVVQSLSTQESYMFDMKRPIRTVALEPNFAKRSSRAFVCGGMAGTLVLREKGWLGHKETVLHSGEGPIWHVRWRTHLIAWANDFGVKIYDTQSQSRITYIERAPDSPRADLFKCTLHWQDDTTLLIAWADHIKVARIRARPRTTATSSNANLSPLLVEVTAAFQLDHMISGILPHPMSTPPPPKENGSIASSITLTSFLVLAYEPPDDFGDEMTDDRIRQARKTAERPELRIISRTGEEISADVLSVAGYQSWACNDYLLAEVDAGGSDTDRCYIVGSPKDIVFVRPRDRRDHIAWLVERQRYEEALDEAEKLGEDEATTDSTGHRIDVVYIGERYLKYLVGEDIQDQVLLLVEFDQELREKRKETGVDGFEPGSEAISMLVDHAHSIPVDRVVEQLRSRPDYLFLYLDALFKKDQHLASDFADIQVQLFADYAAPRLIEYLRASNYYNLEAAYSICRSRDFVPEMVFLLGRMGNNKKALNLIIERIGDVQQAIAFAKEQNDDDLWEDLLGYSETRPTFIRGLLENVGAEIDPIRLIRRIKNGLEIPGLKEALIKILHDFQLQISLLEGCQTIMNGDCSDLAKIRQKGQNSGFFLGEKATCPLCVEPLRRLPQDLLLLFLCRHLVHATCIDGVDDLPRYNEGVLDTRLSPTHELSTKIAL